MNKLFVDFFTFSHNFLHRKWVGTRLLQAKGKYASCLMGYAAAYDLES